MKLPPTPPAPKPPAPRQLLVAVPRAELLAVCELPWEQVLARGYRTIAVDGAAGRQFQPRAADGAAQAGWEDWPNLALLRRGDGGPLAGRAILLQQNW